MVSGSQLKWFDTIRPITRGASFVFCSLTLRTRRVITKRQSLPDCEEVPLTGHDVLENNMTDRERWARDLILPIGHAVNSVGCVDLEFHVFDTSIRGRRPHFILWPSVVPFLSTVQLFPVISGHSENTNRITEAVKKVIHYLTRYINEILHFHFPWNLGKLATFWALNPWTLVKIFGLSLIINE